MRAVLFSLILTPMLSAQEDDAPKPRDLINQAIRAHGGKKLLRKYRAIEQKLEGEVRAGEAPTRFKSHMWVQSPDKIRNDMQILDEKMPYEIVRVINGKKGWTRVGTKTEEMSEKMLASAHRELYASGMFHLYPLLGKDFKRAPVKEKEVDGRPAYGVKIQRKDKPDVTLFFDKKKHFLVQLVFDVAHPAEKDKEVSQAMTFGDYKENDQGLMLPRKLSVHQDGELIMKAKVIEIKSLEKLDEDVLKKP